MAAVASRTGPLGIAIRGLFDNIGRLTTYAATFAAFLAGRWVAGMAAAALSVRGLATALVVLRGALIRTGIGALIVGAGELVLSVHPPRLRRGRFRRGDVAPEGPRGRGLGADPDGCGCGGRGHHGDVLRPEGRRGLEHAERDRERGGLREYGGEIRSRAPTRRSRRSGDCCPPPSAIWRSRRPTAWSTASRRC